MVDAKLIALAGAVVVSCFFVFLLRGNEVDSFEGIEGQRFVLCEGDCECRYESTADVKLYMPINKDIEPSENQIVASGHIEFATTIESDELRSIHMTVVSMTETVGDAPANANVFPDLAGTDVSPPAAAGAKATGATFPGWDDLDPNDPDAAAGEEHYMAGATKDARAETSESEFAKNMIKYSFRYGAVGDVEVAEGEHTKVANIKKSLIAQLQIECPLVARDAPYEIDEVGTDGSSYSALYSVRVVTDEDKSDWYGGDQLEVSKIVEYISEDGQAKSVDINFRVTSTGVLISADVMGTAAGVVSKLDGMDNTSGDPPKVDASVSTFWSCRPKARRLEETPDSKPEWAIKWDATKTKKTTILHKKTLLDELAHRFRTALHSVALHPWRVDQAANAAKLLEDQPDLYEVMEEIFESKNVELDHLARYVMYGIICAGESKLGHEYMMNRLDNGLFKDEEEAGQLRAEIACVEGLLNDDERQEERVRPGRRLGVKKKEGEPAKKERLKGLLRKQSEKKNERKTDELTDAARMALHDDIAKKHHDRELWGHRHRPHRHRPHHHRPHHHRPHRHRPHHHDPHVHSPTGANIICDATKVRGSRGTAGCHAMYASGGGNTKIDFPNALPGASQVEAYSNADGNMNDLYDTSKIELKTDVKRTKIWEKSLWGCGFLCIYFKNGWHARRAGNARNPRWADGSYADDGSGLGAQLVQGQKIGFGIFGFDFVLYELVGGVRSYQAYTNPSAHSSAKETDHGVYASYTFMGKGGPIVGGHGGWTAFQWDSNSMGSSNVGALGPDLSNGHCHRSGASLIGQRNHCTSRQTCSTRQDRPFMCEGSDLRSDTRTWGATSKCLYRQLAGTGGPAQGSNFGSKEEITKVYDMMAGARGAAKEAKKAEAAKKAKDLACKDAKGRRLDRRQLKEKPDCSINCGEVTEQYGMTCELKLDISLPLGARFYIGLEIGTSLIALIKGALNAVSGGSPILGATAGWVIEQALSFLGISASISLEFGIELNQYHMYRQAKCSNLADMRRLYQRVEGTLGLVLTARAQISMLFFRVGIEITVTLIEGYLSATGTSDQKALNYYSSGIGARALRSHAKLWIQLGISIWYPCRCRWSGWWFGCDNCYWTSWGVKWDIDLFNSEGFNIAGNHHNIQGHSGPVQIRNPSRRLEGIEDEYEGTEDEEANEPGLAPDDVVEITDASVDKDAHLYTSIVEVKLDEGMVEHCGELEGRDTGIRCGLEKLVDGETGDIFLGFGFEYGIQVIFDEPKTVGKVKLHDCTGIPMAGEMRLQIWVAGDLEWTTLYEGPHVGTTLSMITARDNVAAVRVDGALTDAIYCFTELEVSGSQANGPTADMLD